MGKCDCEFTAAFFIIVENPIPILAKKRGIFNYTILGHFCICRKHFSP